MRKIAVFLENTNNRLASVGLELLSEVKKVLGENKVELVGIWLGDVLSEKHQELIRKTGTDRLIKVSSPELLEYDTERYVKQLENVVRKEQFDILLVGSSVIGRDLGPRLSARLKTGLTADATSLELEVSEEKVLLLATRPALGGNIFATIICPRTFPQMSTIRPGVFTIIDTFNGNLKIDNYDYIKVESRVKVIVKIPKVSVDVDLTKAKLIVSGGRGVAKNFNYVKDIASELNTEYASSRALVDTQVSVKSRQVGQTGATVRPNLYLAFGISGAIQHLAGMDKSDIIIAINNDPTAPIFDVASVGIVSDANLILPKLLERIKEIKNNKI